MGGGKHSDRRNYYSFRIIVMRRGLCDRTSSHIARRYLTSSALQPLSIERQSMSVTLIPISILQVCAHFIRSRMNLAMFSLLLLSASLPA